MRYGYGVDLGGTTVKMGLFTEDGRLLDRWEIDTDTSSGGANIPGHIGRSILADMRKRGFEKRDFFGVGIGVPGQVWPDGTADAVNLGWKKLPLIAELESATGLRAVGDNDANCAAMGEYWQGGGKGYKSLVLVTLGTGVGGGIILDGKCLRGAHRAGGEIGHIPVNPAETRVCGCGNRGCLEQYASATGCVRMALETLAATDAPSSLRSVRRVDARAVWEAAKAGDEIAVKIADRFCSYLARGLATVANTVDPEVIVVGGGVSRAGQILIDKTREKYRAYAFNPCKNTPIVLAKLGNDAGIYGCAANLLV